MVYTNLIEPSFVGHSQAPLLRLVPIKRGDMILYYTFQRLDYKRVALQDIATIRIVLRSDSGQPIPFSETGRVCVTLQFKLI